MVRSKWNGANPKMVVEKSYKRIVCVQFQPKNTKTKQKICKELCHTKIFIAKMLEKEIYLGTIMAFIPSKLVVYYRTLSTVLMWLLFQQQVGALMLVILE